MHYEFCTLFDKNYLNRGLSLHASLLEHCASFRLWILCMDDDTYDILEKMKLDKVRLVKMEEFEDKNLLTAKANRDHGEYCWTCASNFIYYILKNNPEMQMIAYLDSDLFFYSSPDPIYQELGQNSIMIIPHRFLPHEHQQQAEKNGIYNVGMIIFRNDENGFACLDWWRQQCLKWCYRVSESGKLGDQKYLEKFSRLFKNVYVLQHKGANLAPWNIKNYVISRQNNQTFIDDDILIFYHFFSDFKIYLPSRWLPAIPPSHYSKRSTARTYIYLPYIKTMNESLKKIREFWPGFNGGTISRLTIFKYIKHKIADLFRRIIKKIISQNILSKIIIKTLKISTQPIRGKNIGQNFFINLYHLSLIGMNIGQGSDPTNSGEVYAIKYIKEKVKNDKKPIIFDVGANIGKYTLLLDKFFDKEKPEIFSFEPSKKSFQDLKINTREIKNLKIFNFGFGEKEYKTSLFAEKAGSSLSSLYKRKLDHFDIQMKIEETVEIKSIDDFCLKNNINHINFLKLDAKGNELKILKGAKKMIDSEKVDFIQFEFGGCNIESKTNFQDFYYLLNPRYQIYRILKNGLFPIKKYRETNEIFLTTNYLAVKR